MPFPKESAKIWALDGSDLYGNVKIAEEGAEDRC